MDRNTLTGLLTALAVAPLYFKEPSQPATEKWEFCQVTITGDMDFGWQLNAPESVGEAYLVKVGEDQKWQGLWGGETITPPEVTLVPALTWLYSSLRGRAYEAIVELAADGWEPFQVSECDFRDYNHFAGPNESTRFPIYYMRRRIQ